jgi:hypothetical protein
MNVTLSRTGDNTAALRFRLATVVLQTGAPNDARQLAKIRANLVKTPTRLQRGYNPTNGYAPVVGRQARCDVVSAKRANAVAVLNATTGPGSRLTFAIDATACNGRWVARREPHAALREAANVRVPETVRA